MPTVDLTPRLARQSKPQAKDTFLFDRALPGFVEYNLIPLI